MGLKEEFLAEIDKCPKKSDYSSNSRQFEVDYGIWWHGLDRFRYNISPDQASQDPLGTHLVLSYSSRDRIIQAEAYLQGLQNKLGEYMGEEVLIDSSTTRTNGCVDSSINHPSYYTQTTFSLGTIFDDQVVFARGGETSLVAVPTKYYAQKLIGGRSLSNRNQAYLMSGNLVIHSSLPQLRIGQAEIEQWLQEDTRHQRIYSDLSTALAKAPTVSLPK